MLKEMVLGTLLVGLSGILVAGDIIRTVDKTGNLAEARGLGEGYGHGAGDAQGRDEGDRADVLLPAGWPKFRTSSHARARRHAQSPTAKSGSPTQGLWFVAVHARVKPGHYHKVGTGIRFRQEPRLWAAIRGR